MAKLTSKNHHQFRGAGLPAAFGEADSSDFRLSLTDGTAEKTSGGLELIVAGSAAATAELNQGDVLAYDIDELIRVEFCARVDDETGNGISPDTEIFIGLVAARDDDADAMTGVFFRAKGTDLTLEMNNGNGTDIDNYDTELDLNEGQWQRYVIDFATGTKSNTYGASGGKSELQFKASGNGIDKTSLRPIATSQSFDMGSYTGGLQLFARVSKAATADEVTLTIRDICVQTRDN